MSATASPDALTAITGAAARALALATNDSGVSAAGASGPGPRRRRASVASVGTASSVLSAIDESGLSAAEKGEVRRRLLRELVLAESEEAALGDALMVLLDQIGRSSCSDALFNAVLSSGLEAVKAFGARILAQLPASAVAGTGATGADPGAARAGQSEPPVGNAAHFLHRSFRKRGSQSSLDTLHSSVRRRSSSALTSSFSLPSGAPASASSIRDAQLALAAVDKVRHAFGFEEMPQCWQVFLTGGAQEPPRAGLSADGGSRASQVILDIYLTKLASDRARVREGLARGAAAPDFGNEPALASFVLEFMLARHGTRSEAQRALAVLLQQLCDAEINDGWVNAFRALCGVGATQRSLREPTCHAAYASALYCLLVALDRVAGHLPTEEEGARLVVGASDVGLPLLDADLCRSVLRDLRRLFAFIDLERSLAALAVSKTDEVCVSSLLTVVYEQAAASARDYEHAIYSVFADFCKPPGSEYDFDAFCKLTTTGLERVLRRSRGPAVQRDVFRALQRSCESVDGLAFVHAVTLIATPGLEAQAYDACVQRQAPRDAPA